MSNPKNPDDLPEEKLEEIVERVKEEVEEIVHEQEVLGDPNRPPDYDPEFTREVLELDVEDPAGVASALARQQHAENEFNDLLAKERTEELRAPDLARLVDEAVLAKPLEKKPSLWQRTKAWYHRRGPRFKYNAEMGSGAFIETFIGAPIGGVIGDAVFKGVSTPQWYLDAREYVANMDIWYVSDLVADLTFPEAAVTLTTMIAAGAMYWTAALYLRSRDEKSVYEKYPEIKKKDTLKFLGFGLFVGLGGTFLRAYATYKMQKFGYDGGISGLVGTLPSQAFAFTLMNIWGSVSGLVRDEEKLEKAILKVEEKRFKDEEELKAKNDHGDYTPG